ncbi:MAG: redoxin [Gammaproteobacteria bacterium HGW-Gammaproteobacteria-3]|nr:MAG: redoxin [Gammaproteobacteria bacterium HGW-Gammaproteobacteria-3]
MPLTCIGTIKNSARTAVLAYALATVATAHAATVGEPMPHCELAPIDAAAVSGLENFRGKVLYVDFWASWCPPCVKSFPFMNQLVRDYKAQGLEVIGINLDEINTDAAQFLDRHPTQFTVLADLAKTCARDFEVKAMPSTYLVDRNGIIRHIHLGFRSGAEAELKENIERLLADNANAE